MKDLVAGNLPLSDYARFLAQLHAVYEALEEGVAANTDEALAPLFAPELVRVPALRRDLEAVAGEGWTELPLMPATEAYRARLRDLAENWPAGLLGHHYVRYMGDLSGGQVIGRVLRRTLELEGEEGTSFYFFDEITSPKEFKERYRANLDALGWDTATRQRLIDEASYAFTANTAIVRELSQS